MAQAQNNIKSDSTCSNFNSSDAQNSVPECAVCLQFCIHPACLPCKHVFCYLCIKGVANQSKRCPMCRQEIPVDFLEKPQLLETSSKEIQPDDSSLSEEYQWFYEGRNGWWQYDERTNMELETAFKEGKRSCELLIAGFLYVADFSTMFQLRRNDHSRRRRIKRDLYNIPKKGVAGLRLRNTVNSEQDEVQQLQVTREVRRAERSSNNTSSREETNISESVQETSDEDVRYGNSISLDTTTSSEHELLDSFNQVLEQMHSLVLNESHSSTNQYFENRPEVHLFPAESLLPHLHQRFSTAQSSDEEQINSLTDSSANN